MNILKTLQHALDNELPIIAHVRLYNGEYRVRLGFVHNIQNDLAVIYDIQKGFRTTPLPFFQSVEIVKNQRNKSNVMV